MTRRLVLLLALGLALAVPAAAAQTEPARLAVTATADRCADGLPVVDYTVTNQWSAPVSVQTWWVADASVYGIASTHDLGPAPDSAAGSFTLPFGFYATVTVYATAFWSDGRTTTNASWAIPVAACGSAPATTPSTPPSTVVAPPTTVDDDNGPGNGHGNGNGRPTTSGGVG